MIDLSFARRRRRLLTAVVAAIVAIAVSVVTLDSAQGGPVSAVAPDGIVVIGDSITARHNAESGDEKQGWWSMVAEHYEAEVVTFAESGSGFVRPGNGCRGTRFVDRVDALDRTPSILMIEGGRNDWAKCVDGRLRRASNSQIRRAVDDYFSTVQPRLPNTRVIVLGPPWGPRQQLDGLRVTAIVQQMADKHGFEFVDTTGTLTGDHVTDGIHPNRGGSRAIADRVIASIG